MAEGVKWRCAITTLLPDWDTQTLCPVCREQPLPPHKSRCSICDLEETASVNADIIARDLSQRTAEAYPQNPRRVQE